VKQLSLVEPKKLSSRHFFVDGKEVLKNTVLMACDH